MRARSIKPGIFRNELLAAADPLHTIIFQGLWCMADRLGRLEDRPAKIHINVNPCRSMKGTESALKWLCDTGFITRYESAGVRYIQVENFLKHQNPHCKEAASTIPAPDKHSASMVLSRLTPDSGLLTPDSGLLTVSSGEESEVAHAPSPPPSKQKAKLATRIPEGWQPSPDLIAYAEKELPNVDTAKLAESFTDYWQAAAGAKARKLDWDATWRTWVRRSCDRYPTKAQSRAMLPQIRIDANGRQISG